MNEIGKEKELTTMVDLEKKPSWYNQDFEELKIQLKDSKNLKLFDLIDKAKATKKKMNDYSILEKSYELFEEKRTYSDVAGALSIGQERAIRIFGLYKNDKKRWRKK